MKGFVKDSLGEVPWEFAQLFEAGPFGPNTKPAIFSLLFPDDEQAKHIGERIFIVRLYRGEVEREGKLFRIEEGKNPPLFRFTEELLAASLRKQQATPEWAGVKQPKPARGAKKAPPAQSGSLLDAPQEVA